MAGRPREFDREQALERARDLFWAHGYEGTSMADLVATLGIASARIYAAFRSKEALFREAVALYERGDGGFADRALAQEPSLSAALERVFREAIGLYTGARRPRGCMIVSAGDNLAPENRALAGWLSELRRARTSGLIARFERAARDGELARDADPRALGDLCAAYLHGLSVQARDGVTRARLEKSAAQFVAALPWRKRH